MSSAPDEDFDDEFDDLDEEEIGAPGAEPFRDGQIHVMAEKCATCVFRPGNPMNLPPGRLKGMTDSVQETGVPFSCHQTLPYSETRYQEHYGGAALCHGAVEKYGDQSVIMRMAASVDEANQRAGLPPFIVEHEPYRRPVTDISLPRTADDSADVDESGEDQ